MMRVSPNDLRKDTLELIKEIDAQIEKIRSEIASSALAGEMYVSLLQAKATAYNTLVLLQTQGRR